MNYVIDRVFDRYAEPDTIARIVDYTDMTQMWRSCCRQYSDLPAIDDGRIYTYGELDGLAAGVRGILADAKVEKGSRVGIFMPNSVQFVYSFIGCATYGATAVLIPPQLDEMTLFIIYIAIG